MANNFLVYKNLKVGKSLVENNTKEVIEKIYKKAVEDRYSFLTVDLLQQDPSRIFMKRFESYLVPQ